MYNRREFLRNIFLGAGSLSLAQYTRQISKSGSSPETLPAVPQAAANIFPTDSFTHKPIDWKTISPGLEFAKVEIFQSKNHVETIAVLRVRPSQTQIRVFNSYEGEKTVVRDLEEWQKFTSATAIINSAQYMAHPYFMPCALILCDGIAKGPRMNPQVRGMLVAEPNDQKSPRADLLDFEYDKFDLATNRFTQGVQHWPILLDRAGSIKVKQTPYRAKRSIVAKNFNGDILFLTTEGSFFTLHDLGNFLRESNRHGQHGLGIHTAMNLDGGKEANMLVRAPKFSYFSAEPQSGNSSSDDNPSLFTKVKMPGVIGIFSR
jgi:hypothetical protein